MLIDSDEPPTLPCGNGVGNEEREVIGDGGAALPALTENIIPPT